MADRMTRQQRHLCMSHIRSKDTKPEVAVRKGLFAAGFRYRLNVSALPGTPDIVLKKYNTAMLLITHDMGVVAQTCDDVAVIYAGKIIEYGSKEQIFVVEKHDTSAEIYTNSFVEMCLKWKENML